MCNDDNPKKDMATNYRRFGVDDLRVDHSASYVLVRIMDSVTGIIQERDSIVFPPFRPRYFHHVEHCR